MMQGELLTEKGLRHFNYGFVISMVAYGIIGILFLTLLITFPNVEDDEVPFGGPFGFWGPVVWFLIGIVLAIFVLLVSLIFFLIGLLSLNNGRWEFGMRHSSTFQKGMLFVIVGFVISLFGGAGFGILGSFVGVVTTVLISLGLMYMILEISDESTRRLLLYSAIMFISISVISAIISLFLLLALFNFDGPGFNNIWLLTVIPVGLGSLNIIPLGMFFIAYRRTYYRINKREIKPIPPPPMIPYPMPYPPYPQYPPQYPQPYQYPQRIPPPQYPPPNIGIKAMPQGYSQPQGYVPPGSIRCTSCGATIPRGVNVCPVCFAEQKK
jgi:MFS family permease